MSDMAINNAGRRRSKQQWCGRGVRVPGDGPREADCSRRFQRPEPDKKGTGAPQHKMCDEMFFFFLFLLFCFVLHVTDTCTVGHADGLWSEVGACDAGRLCTYSCSRDRSSCLWPLHCGGACRTHCCPGRFHCRIVAQDVPRTHVPFATSSPRRGRRWSCSASHSNVPSSLVGRKIVFFRVGVQRVDDGSGCCCFRCT